MRSYRLTRDEILGMPYSEVVEMIDQLNASNNQPESGLEDW